VARKARGAGVIDERARMLARVRAALAPLATREPMPNYPDEVAVARGAVQGKGVVASFVEQLTKAGGRAFTDPRALAQWLAQGGEVRGYCDPRLMPEIGGALLPDLVVETKLVRKQIDDYRFGITRAAGAIAETGTLILEDGTTSSRLAALAPWIHVAVVRSSTIHLRVVDAVRALGADPNVVWCTGPSKTADVEGILIQGVHGPGEQVALIVE
jgi:L-lactate dehydrogenase complex protein LldG